MKTKLAMAHHLFVYTNGMNRLDVKPKEFVCPVCGKKFLRLVSQTQTPDPACSRICGASKRRGADHPMWRGGRLVLRSGYVRVQIPDGRVLLEHRWVMEQKIGRPLLRNEVVHHINGVRHDNRVENLRLLKANEHQGHHHKGTRRAPLNCCVCGETAKARGLCEAHYKRLRRRGILTPLWTR